MKIGAKLGFAFLIAVLALLIFGFVYHNNLEKADQAKFWVEHTYQVLGKLDSLSCVIARIESSTRGFCVSSDSEYLADYEQLKEKPREELDEIKKLTGDNPAQQHACNELAAKIDEKLEFNRNLIAAGQKSLEESASLLKRKIGLKLRVGIDKSIDAMKQEEHRLLDLRIKNSAKAVEEAERVSLYGTVAAFFFVGLLGLLVSRSITSNLSRLQTATAGLGAGDFSIRAEITGKDELSSLAQHFNEMAAQLESLSKVQTSQAWLRDSFRNLAETLHGLNSLDALGTAFLDKLIPLVGAQQATLYVVVSPIARTASNAGSSAHELKPSYMRSDEEFGKEQRILSLIASHACERPEHLPNSIAIGEGLLGQAAKDGKRVILNGLAPDSLTVTSSLIRSSNLSIIVQPVEFSDNVIAVLELASLHPFSETHTALIENFAPWLGSVINSIQLNQFTIDLLKEAQTLNEDLQAQQEELEVQQEELRQTNEELEQKTDELEEQNIAISGQKEALDTLNKALGDKQSELMLASKYKSDFLANMSHDLRTPLNSMLIFAEILADNEYRNLSDEQVEFARTIRASGNSLLSLINDVLDLSKIESGKVLIEPAPVLISELISSLKSTFNLEAQVKGLEFSIVTEQSTPEKIHTDEKRLFQILNNLLANAFKFTKQGSVLLSVLGQNGQNGNTDSADTAGAAVTSGTTGASGSSGIRFSIKDTGIGISKEKQAIVFEPFQQAETTIQREFGGTGLGLSICRELANLLGGKITLVSEPEQGSEFVLWLPLVCRQETKHANFNRGNYPSPETTSKPFSNSIPQPVQFPKPDFDFNDDRDSLSLNDRTLLIIEDDPAFARVLLETARKNEFKAVVAGTGASGIRFARDLAPDGITLDLHLPDIDGWVVLDQLKSSIETRHIPVHVISVETERVRALSSGAVGSLQKPSNLEGLVAAIRKIKERKQKQSVILLVEAHSDKAKQCSDLLMEECQQFILASSAGQAIEILKRQQIDCVVVGADLADMSIVTFVETVQEIESNNDMPLLVYPGTEPDSKEQLRLRELGKTGIVRDIVSVERLLLETTLFLHRVEANLPANKRSMIQKALNTDATLRGRKILIVDDDARNQAALKSLLERLEMNLVFANNGMEALQQLQSHPDTHLVLMDMMMPEMDGYEAMREIRKKDLFKEIPVIAVTAKAMKEDRRLCLESGASDYISKPVDKRQLLSLLRVWLSKK